MASAQPAAGPTESAHAESAHAESGSRTDRVLSRRERVRAQTAAEIKTVARAHLVEHGVHGVQLRAIARDLGMTAPALYRYFDSHEALLTDLVGDLYAELADVVERAAAPEQGELRDRLQGAARAFRGWSVTHPAEFTLLFGSPIPGVETAEDSPAHVHGRRFGQAFGRLFTELWEHQPFPVPTAIDPQMDAALLDYAAHVGISLPPEAIAVFLSCWIKLYGAVTMEVFGHISFALADAEPLFDFELVALLERLGLGADPQP